MEGAPRGAAALACQAPAGRSAMDTVTLPATPAAPAKVWSAAAAPPAPARAVSQAPSADSARAVSQAPSAGSARTVSGEAEFDEACARLRLGENPGGKTQGGETQAGGPRGKQSGRQTAHRTSRRHRAPGGPSGTGSKLPWPPAPSPEWSSAGQAGRRAGRRGFDRSAGDGSYPQETLRIRRRPLASAGDRWHLQETLPSAGDGSHP